MFKYLLYSLKNIIVQLECWILQTILNNISHTRVYLLLKEMKKEGNVKFEIKIKEEKIKVET